MFLITLVEPVCLSVLKLSKKCDVHSYLRYKKHGVDEIF